MEYNKLIRDKIPEIIKSKGETFRIHTAEDQEYKEKLGEKLLEEVKEFLESDSPRNEVEEIVDILEIIDAICKFSGFDKKEIEEIKKEKFEKRGGFEKRIILEES